jgi:hypothetical protein
MRSQEVKMIVRPFLLLSAAIIFSVVTPAAAEGPPPQVVDPCGDATSNVYAASNRADVESNRQDIDIAAVTLRGIYAADDTFEGVTATISLCGQPRPIGNGYGVSWSYPSDNCTARLGIGLRPETLDRTHSLLPEHSLTYKEECPQTPEEFVAGSTTRVELPAEALRYGDSRISFDLRVRALPARLAARFAVGTPWSEVGAKAVESDRHVYTSYFMGKEEVAWLSVRMDVAAGEATYVVGGDCPCHDRTAREPGSPARVSHPDICDRSTYTLYRCSNLDRDALLHR